MSLRGKFIVFAVIIHAVMITLSLLLFPINKYLILAAEAVIILSLVVTIHLYNAFLKPLNLLAAGIETIKDRDFSITFVKTGQQELDQLIDVYNRMIEQLRQERIKQREQHYFLERLIEVTPIGIVILDLDGKINMLNPAARNLLGVVVEETSGCPLESLAHPIGGELKEMDPGETRIIRVTGMQTFRCRKSQFLDRGFHRHFILIEEMTREIMVTQRNAYDKVIRMMSHEINNSVGAVNSILNSSLNYKNQLKPDDLHDFEQAIKVAINRNTGLNRFMSNFADVVRVPSPHLEAADLHRVLESVHTLMSNECAERDIEWIWELENSPFLVDMDVHQMEQVLVNIIKNSIEAVDRDGTIRVKTSSSRGIKMLSISDDGRGISEDELMHLFTPFYSTKKNGQGIGLTLIREILTNHNFSFNLEGGDNGQTEFWIRFDSRSSESGIRNKY